MIKPVGQKVALEIIENLEHFARDVKKRSGLLVASSTTQGQPVSGRVYAIADDITDPEYRIGDVVIFKLDNNEPFVGHRLDDKKLVFVLHRQIVGLITEEDV